MYYLQYDNPYNNNDDEIAALLPVYTEGVGDTTEVIEMGGKRRVLHSKINSVINQLFILHATSIGKIRRKYEGIILQKNKPPLPLSQELILLPFKVRRPLVKGDPAYGYINYISIKSYDRAGKYSKLFLTNGIEIHLIQSLATTQKNIMQAKLIASEMELRKHRKETELINDILNLKNDIFTLF